MKTTIEMPDALFRQAKIAAAICGVSFQKLYTEAMAEKLNSLKKKLFPEASLKRGFGVFGKNKKIVEDTRRIQKIIDEEFGKVDASSWK
ncbi:MAG: hypothetical protein ACOY3I_02550 [Verrucomicrobiota bacterium]